ncbi:MAG: hypothetical protein WC506_05965 [Candidatus Micrarchaeia archaeon]
MGRSIPSATARIDAKIAQWEAFGRALGKSDRKAFDEIMSVIRDRRTAIDAANEADIGIAMVLAAAVYLKRDRDETARKLDSTGKQARLEDGDRGT